jgi:hypothetical protein
VGKLKRLRHPVALFVQKSAKSQIQGQTFVLEQSFGLKARFFKGQGQRAVLSRAKSSREDTTSKSSCSLKEKKPFFA